MISPEEAGKIVKAALDEMHRDVATSSAEAANYIEVLRSEGESSVLVLHDTQAAHEWAKEKLKAHEADHIPQNQHDWRYSYYLTMQFLLRELIELKQVKIWEAYAKLEETCDSSLFTVGFCQACNELMGGE